MVDLLILRYRVIRLRNHQAVLEGGRSADNHEFCFQVPQRSDMDCVELQGCLFADCQEWNYQVAKHSDN